MVHAETHIKAVQILYPTISLTRGRVLAHELLGIGTGVEWGDDGRIVWEEGYEPEGYRQAVARVEGGEVVDLEKLLREDLMSDQKRSMRSGTSLDTPEYVEERVRDALKQREHEWPSRMFCYPHGDNCRDFHCCSTICRVPKNVTDDWLVCVVDTVEGMLACGTDYRPQDQHNWSEPEDISPEDAAKRKSLAEEIIDRLCAKEGIKPRRRTEAEIKKDREEWEQFHSPQALAKRQNHDNAECIKLGKQLVLKLLNKFGHRPQAARLNHHVLRLVGHKVKKVSNKPFKSGLQIATVSGVTTNPNSGKDAFTFEEDDSVVDVRQLSLHL